MSGNEKISELDKVLTQFNVFGRYHCLFMFWSFLALASNAVFCSNFVFSAEEVSYRCKDEGFGNDTCTNMANSTAECSEWTYEDPNSFVAEFGLACQDWKRTLVGTMHSFGYMVGLLLVGPMSDRLGRKLSIVITGMLGGVFGVARSFTSNYWLFIALEFLEGAIGDSCSPMFILTIEIVSSRNRLLFYILCSFGYPFGGVLVSLSAWKFTYWRTFLRVIYMPALLFFAYLFLIDESPRWLLIKGKKDKAIKIIEKAAEKNKIKIDKTLLEKMECEKEKSVNFFRLLKMTFESKIILKRFLICLVWWTTSTFVAYGLSINSVSLRGNKYVNYALTSLMDVPANFIILLSQNYFKRKAPLITSFLVGAFLCLAHPFLPANLSWLSLIMYMASKLMSSFYFTITYMFTSELFPTYTRNSMHALCSSLGRIGSIIAPQTPLLMHYWSGLPSLVFGSVSLIAGLITFLVPDTADNSLPDTVKQAEEIGKKGDLKKPAPDFVIDKDKDCSRL
ncbi:organic cation transporter protein [Amyelois transitella]|uniref:organic cation transporter protein n=1 Tax=Amyelois transitella TaxID=680683 RepID=UPI00298F84E1|nr:organic cation transporter protein [Amyelois transitella]